MWRPTDIQALSDLFSQGDAVTSFPAENELTPASIGPQYEPRKKSPIEEAIEAADRDTRLQPEYEFIYKQAVTPNDVYLQMSEKTPSMVFCEDLVMKIKLPDTESSNEIQLDVKPTYVKLTSPNYYLAMYLPHKVNDTRSSAKWDAVTTTLTITMPIVERNMLET